jgi:hypothetical protein
VAVFLGVLGVISRWPVRARVLPTWDAIQFALALDEFDVVRHQPHPPGYILYVLLGRAVDQVVGDPPTSLAVLAALASGVTLVVLYRLGLRLYDRPTALLATAGLLVSPLFWFYGLVGLSYAAEAALVTLVVLAAWLASRGDRRALVLSTVALALAAGVRQSILPLLLPLWLLAAWRGLGRRWQPMALLLLLMSLVIGLWLVPLVVSAGGPTAYLGASLELFDSTVRGTSVMGGRWLPNLERLTEASLLGLGLFLPVLVAAGVVAIRRGLPGRPRAWLFLAWGLPPLLVYALVHVGQYGYLLTVLPAAYLLVARALVAGQRRLEPRLGPGPAWTATAGAVAVILAVHASFALAAPRLDVRFPETPPRGLARWQGELAARYRFALWPHTVPGLRDTETVIATYIEAVRSRFEPAGTLLVTELGNPRSYPWFRHVSYYLPEYRTLHLRIGAFSRGFIATGGERGMTALADPDVVLPPSIRRLVWVVDYWSPGVPRPPGLETFPIPQGRFLYALDLGRQPVEHAGYRLTPVTAVARLK